MKLTKLKAREVLDSRGNPTVEVEASTKSNVASAIVPSGASTGVHEALELRDGDIRRYGGMGVLQAVANVNRKIAPKLKGMKVTGQHLIDEMMLDLDGTENKEHLGANAILGVSLAMAKLGAKEKGVPLYQHLGKKKHLPVPFCNVLNGGVHAGSDLKIQEFMIAPVKAKSFSEGIRMVAEVYHDLKKILVKKYGRHAINVGDEGGFVPPLKTPHQAFDVLTKAIEQHGYQKYIKFAIDAAASEFYRKGYYYLPKRMDSDDLLEYYNDLIKTYPLISIEDPFDQDDFAAFKKMNKKIQIVGDDLICTNIHRLKVCVKNKLANCMLMKVNQIGTVTEAIDAAKFALKHKMKVMVSHRSGDSEDTFIADLAVGLGSGQMKSGAPARGERTAKYNRLLRLSESVKGYGLQ